MKYCDDPVLTVYQQQLKWYLYLEFKYEMDEDVKSVLQSLLGDLMRETENV